MQLFGPKTSLALMLIAALYACRLSCLGFTWQPASHAESAHSCCHKSQQEKSQQDRTEPTESGSHCKSEVFESVFVSANLALAPALHQVPNLDLVEIGQRLDTSFNTPLHSPPDLLALHQTLLI